MEENEELEQKEYSKVPAKVDKWSSFKKVALHEIKVELTPYQQKVFQEVSDFWNQEIYLKGGEIHLRPRDSMLEEAQEMPNINVEL